MATFTEQVVASIRHLLRSNSEIQRILNDCRADVVYKDTWYPNGRNTGVYELRIDIDLVVFDEYSDTQIAAMERAILGAGQRVFKGLEDRHLEWVVIAPWPLDTIEPPLRPQTVERRAVAKVDHIWGKGDEVWLFVSHTSKHARHADALRKALKPYGISAFVAHRNIKAGKEWADEIELALNSCHALCSIFTRDFKESDYTDHEMGYAWCRRIPILQLVVHGKLPYGFMSKYQAIKTDIDAPRAMALKIAQDLLDQDALGEAHKDHIRSLMPAAIRAAKRAQYREQRERSEQLNRNVGALAKQFEHITQVITTESVPTK